MADPDLTRAIGLELCPDCRRLVLTGGGTWYQIAAPLSRIVPWHRIFKYGPLEPETDPVEPSEQVLFQALQQGQWQTLGECLAKLPSWDGGRHLIYCCSCGCDALVALSWLPETVDRLQLRMRFRWGGPDA
jgi:hypothetical protein